MRLPTAKGCQNKWATKLTLNNCTKKVDFSSKNFQSILYQYTKYAIIQPEDL